jgi:photosystem II stability/assembly factor-like uncharacterized protein
LLDGEPAKLAPVGRQRLLLALADGAILETRNGGADWERRFEP